MFHDDFPGEFHNGYWITKNIERMGLPFYFSEENNGLAIIEEGMVPDMTDEQIEKLFEKSVLIDGQSALDLIQRGYGELLGVNVKEWTKGSVSAETFDKNAYFTCTSQKKIKRT